MWATLPAKCGEDLIENENLGQWYPALKTYYSVEYDHNRLPDTVPLKPLCADQQYVWNAEQKQLAVDPLSYGTFYGRRLRERTLRIPFTIRAPNVIQGAGPVTVNVSSDAVKKLFLHCTDLSHGHGVVVLDMVATSVETVNLIYGLAVGLEMESTEPPLAGTGAMKKQWWGRISHTVDLAHRDAPTYPLVIGGISKPHLEVPLYTAYPRTTTIPMYEILRGCIRPRMSAGMVNLQPPWDYFTSTIHQRLRADQYPQQDALDADTYTQVVNKIADEQKSCNSLWRGDTTFKCHLLGDVQKWQSIMDSCKRLRIPGETEFTISIILTVRIHALIVGYPSAPSQQQQHPQTMVK